MKKNTIIFLIFGMIIFPITKTSAHREWVHQYLVGEGVKFLEANAGSLHAINIQDLANLKNQIFYSDGTLYTGHGSNHHPWDDSEGKYVALGAYREDIDDPIWYYGYGGTIGTVITLGGNDVTPSITHFWKADNGDDETHNISVGNTVIKANAQNAWTKARAYLFGTEKITFANFDVGLTSDFGVTSNIAAVKISYTSLIEFFKTGHCYIYSGFSYDGTESVLPEPIEKFINLNAAHKYGYQILGRVAHLLGDMSVPAHVHVDTHPCDIGQPDAYEQHMGGVRDHSRFTCNEQQTSYPAQNYNYTTTSGSILQGDNYCEKDEVVVRYIFYTMNQVSVHFPSGFDDADSFTSNGEFTSGYDSGNSCTCNMNADLAIEYINMWNHSNLNSPNTSDSDGNHFPNSYLDAWGGEMVNFSIRATASLFYWFLRRINEGGPVMDYDLVLQNTTIRTPTITYQAVNNITASNVNIDCSQNNTAVVFRAGNTITLGDGFSTSGCNFHAFIAPCDVTSLKMAYGTGNNSKNNTTTKNGTINKQSNIIVQNSLSTLPSPFSDFTDINYSIKEAGQVKVEVYSPFGQKVATLVNTNQEAGSYKITFDASNLSHGIYFYTMTAGDYRETKRMVLLK